MLWRSGTTTVTGASPAPRRGVTGLRQFPGGIPPTVGCRIGTETEWSANDKQCGSAALSLEMRIHLPACAGMTGGYIASLFALAFTVFLNL